MRCTLRPLATDDQSFLLCWLMAARFVQAHKNSSLQWKTRSPYANRCTQQIVGMSRLQRDKNFSTVLLQFSKLLLYGQSPLSDYRTPLSHCGWLSPSPLFVRLFCTKTTFEAFCCSRYFLHSLLPNCSPQVAVECCYRLDTEFPLPSSWEDNINIRVVHITKKSL